MRILLFLINCLLISIVVINCQSVENLTKSDIDFQGHRGCRGLLPENSIPAFLKALEFPIKTLEMDAAVSRDGKIIISHDPWFNPEICHPVGTQSAENLQKTYIRNLTYNQIKQFDCGSKGNKNFPEQTKMKVHKPSLEEVVNAVNEYCKVNNRAFPYYNIEIKTSPDWDTITAPVNTFAKILLNEISKLNISDKACIQSFDIRALQAVRALDQEITLAYLIGDREDPEKQIESLGFTPDIYSPYHQLVNRALVSFCAEQGMLLIPWTVNDLSTMRTLIKKGVDGIITDYPNLIEAL